MLILATSGCGSTEDENTDEPILDSNTVIIEDYKYKPAEITIKSGETITWINKDGAGHTATGDSFDSGLLGRDKSYKQTFDEVGTFDYICTPHPYMKGKVIVQ